MKGAPTIASLLKRIRLARHLTQRQLAAELGVSFATVNGWENGRHEPIPSLATAIRTLADQIQEDGEADKGPARRAQRSTRRSRRTVP